MDDDFIAKIDAEEAALEVKLAALRQLKAVYGMGPKPATRPSARATSAPTGPRPSRPLSDRMDKFGSYGSSVINAAMDFLPGVNQRPIMTRDLVEKLEARGVAIRGENKVNALSALLARSTRVKGHGRSGWTSTVDWTASTNFDEMLGGNAPPNENEPHSGSAGGSDAGSEDVGASSFHQIDL